jgi:hypothetical protein
MRADKRHSALPERGRVRTEVAPMGSPATPFVRRAWREISPKPDSGDF